MRCLPVRRARRAGTPDPQARFCISRPEGLLPGNDFYPILLSSLQPAAGEERGAVPDAGAGPRVGFLVPSKNGKPYPMEFGYGLYNIIRDVGLP